MKERIVIVGAGIAGAYLAYRLARQGSAVLVIDDGRAGRATGWNPGGVNPLHGPGFPGPMAPFYRQAFELHSAHRELVRERSGIDFGWRVVDRLFLARDAEEEAGLRNLAEHYEKLDGFSAHWMSSGDIARWDARMSGDWPGGLMTRGNARVDAERYRLALLATASSMGAETIAGTVRGVETTGERIVAIDCGGEAIPASGLCMATGSWADEPIAGWSPGNNVSVRPSIGDLLLVRSAEPPPLADLSNGLTAIYQHEGDHFWIGGTSRADGPLGETTEEVEQALLAGAHSLMPGWGAPELIARSSAARPASADGLPVVGQTPNYRNGWIINGLGGKGILLSAWTAEIIAGMIDGRPPDEDLALVSPTRGIVDHG